MRTLNHIIFFATVAAAALLMQGTATAGTVPFSIDTADGSGADSYVRLGQPTTNFGSGPQVVVKDSGTGSTTRKGYMRFDVSSLAGHVYTDATLSLDVTTNNQGGGGTTPQTFTVNVFGLNDAHTGETWDETTINWNSAPGNVTGNNHVNNDAAFLGRFTVPAVATPNTVTFSEPELASFLNRDSDGNATLILTRQGGNGGHNLGFSAKEGTANAPLVSGDAELGSTLSLTTNDGSGADSYVRQGQPTTNFGSATQVVVKDNGTSSTTRKGYLRFDLSSLAADALDVSLTFEVPLNNGGGGSTTPQNHVVNVYGLDDLDPGESWNETTINWNNAPANTSGDGLLSNATLLGQFDVPAFPTPSEILFSNQNLLDFINADTNDQATLILIRDTPSGSWNLGFASGEHGSLLAPTLTIAYPSSAVPEPSTFALAALGLLSLGLVGWRRRRKR